jgi:hypothetical protein
MEIDNETKKQILEDYQKINKDITKIVNGILPNCFVRSTHYIEPTIKGPKLPLNDRNGFLQYLIEIREGLESILTGEVPITFRGLDHAPSYVTKVFEEYLTQ